MFYSLLIKLGIIHNSVRILSALRPVCVIDIIVNSSKVFIERSFNKSSVNDAFNLC